MSSPIPAEFRIGAADHVVIVPTSEADVFDLALIHVAAFAADNAVRLIYSGDEHEEAVTNMINSQLRSSDFTIALAISFDLQARLGWIGYRLCGENDLQEQERLSSLNGVQTESNGDQRGDGDEGFNPEESTKATALATLISNTATRMQTKWMAGTKHICITTLATKPQHRGKGVGTAMVRWLVEKADAEGLPCWVQSTSAAHDLYLRAGFEVKDHLEIDLKRFTPMGEAGRYEYGYYGFRYMMRRPENASD